MYSAGDKVDWPKLYFCLEKIIQGRSCAPFSSRVPTSRISKVTLTDTKIMVIRGAQKQTNLQNCEMPLGTSKCRQNVHKLFLLSVVVNFMPFEQNNKRFKPKNIKKKKRRRRKNKAAMIQGGFIRASVSVEFSALKIRFSYFWTRAKFCSRPNFSRSNSEERHGNACYAGWKKRCPSGEAASEL